jgi:iron complex outermembrane receptor protein
MEWAIGTRRSATAAAASVAFYAAAAATAQAQQSAQTEGNAQQNTSTSQAGVRSASTLPSISVEGSADNDDTVGLVARRSSTGTKTDTPLKEIPQTINVVTALQIEETGATSINEALRYIPGFSTYGADVRSDWYSVLRGFTPTVFVDGLQVPVSIRT